MSTSVTFDQASRTYPGSDKPAVDALDLEIEPGEFLVLVGPSGCGKSTSLRMLAGLEDVSSGQILIGDRDVTHVAPKDRDIAMVFQNYALYPHMTVGDNMGFALKIAGASKSEIATRVAEAAKILDLEDYLERKPKALSGGQRQRVAMGRAIVRHPKVFLMDEPLSNLDAKLRVSTRTQIASLQRRLDITTVYVTHDQVEAMTMGDRVAVLKDGVLQQVDTPLGLYDKPANAFVAGFIGSPAMNLGTFTVTDGKARIGEGHVPLPRSTVAALKGDQVQLGFRPEAMVLASEADEASFPVEALVIEELGSDAFLYGNLIGDELRADHVVARIAPRSVPGRGERVWFTVEPGKLHAFDAETGLALPTD
ncbi:ABC transporter ATP-binding protein [Nocardioides sp. SYSU D00065]|uniref:ABC transporter ATP-binding protein n=1 Tax=Nocardioides sp. SYSU D00065 TaxID=2817378 RepID=UPI001B34111D|nr:sn-glycerol-3-phosphate ABC transporter ATP-binding protein UgpC [Nocardioides sp. SYSU D00065]